MKQTDTTMMTRYLLGQLPEAQRDLYEQEWFTDQAQYAQLCEAENALIDAYVRGDLRGPEGTLFEQHFLTIPARRERVQTARALVQELERRVLETHPELWWQRWFASHAGRARGCAGLGFRGKNKIGAVTRWPSDGYTSSNR